MGFGSRIARDLEYTERTRPSEGLKKWDTKTVLINQTTTRRVWIDGKCLLRDVLSRRWTEILRSRLRFFRAVRQQRMSAGISLPCRPEIYFSKDCAGFWTEIYVFIITGVWIPRAAESDDMLKMHSRRKHANPDGFPHNFFQSCSILLQQIKQLHGCGIDGTCPRCLRSR